MKIFNFLKRKPKKEIDISFDGIITKAIEKHFADEGCKNRTKEFLGECSVLEAKRIQDETKIENLLSKYKDNPEIWELINYFSGYDNSLKLEFFKTKIGLIKSKDYIIKNGTWTISPTSEIK